MAARADPLANQLQFHKNMNSHSQKWPLIQAKNIKQYYSREFPEISAIFPLSQISASVLNSLWGLKRIVAVTGVPCAYNTIPINVWKNRKTMKNVICAQLSTKNIKKALLEQTLFFVKWLKCCIPTVYQVLVIRHICNICDQKIDVWVPRYVYSLIPPKMQDSVAENTA